MTRLHLFTCWVSTNCIPVLGVLHQIDHCLSAENSDIASYISTVDLEALVYMHMVMYLYSTKFT